MSLKIRDDENKLLDAQNQRWSQCLLLIASHQDKQAFSGLYDHYAPRINGYLVKQGAAPALAEELTQEALLAVWNKANSYQANIASPNTWIFTIARNLFIDHMRRRSSKYTEPLEAYHLEEYDASNETNSTEEKDIGLEQQMRESIKNLPFIQAQVVYKSFYEGKSHSQISNDMELPLGTVKSNLRLAFQKLRSCFGEIQ